MNILILDKDPKKAAEYHCDSHVLNFIITYSQFLSTAHWLSLYDDSSEDLTFNRLKDMKAYFNEKYPIGSDLRPPYGINYINNNCSHWVYKSKENYLWLCELLHNLCKEYTKRYNKNHKCESYVNWFKNNIPSNIKSEDSTEFVINVPESCRVSNDPVLCYREFYIIEKKSKAKWKCGNIPYWFK